MFEIACSGCPAVPDPDETSCLFCLIPDLDEAELDEIEEKADNFYQNLACG